MILWCYNVMIAVMGKPRASGDDPDFFVIADTSLE